MARAAEQTDRTAFNGTPTANPRSMLVRARALLAIAPQLSRYTLVSAVALGIDMALYLALTGLGMRPASAGILGYLVGGVAHYALSVFLVFDVANHAKTTSRRLAEFFVSGLVGLAITWCVIAASTEILHLPAIIGKVLAVAASFMTVFLIRRGIVFADNAPRKI